MARIRYLKPDFFKDEDLAELPYWVRLLYAGLWNIADKAGRLEDRSKRIKIEIFPYDKVDIEKGLKILAQNKKTNARPFIIRYEVNKEYYIQILNWDKHQKPHHTEKESNLPPIPPSYKDNGEGNGEGKPARSELEVKQPLKNGYPAFEANLFVHWNSLCDKYPILSKIVRISETRRRHLKKRFESKHYQENIQKAIDTISESSFLRGKNDWEWKVTFDWLIQNDTNYLKILEGRYKDKIERDIDKFLKKR